MWQLNGDGLPYQKKNWKMRKCNTKLREKAMRNPNRKVYERNRSAYYDSKSNTLTSCLYDMEVTENFKKKTVSIDGYVSTSTTRQFINDICTGVSAYIRHYEIEFDVADGWKLTKVTAGRGFYW